MSRKLVINADGFGFAAGINRACFEVADVGTISSISCVVNFAAISELPAFHRAFPDISVGVHLNPIVGPPVSPPDRVRSLLNSDGEFLGGGFVPALLRGRLRSEELVRELEAQIAVVREMGIPITHWDGHQNKHLYPGFFGPACSVARRAGIQRMRSHRRYLGIGLRGGKRLGRLAAYYGRRPKRLVTHGWARALMFVAEHHGFRMADRLVSPSYADDFAKWNAATWSALFMHLPEGTSEIYCHPGYADDVLRRYASYVEPREQEVRALTDGAVRGALEASDIELISFDKI